MVRKPSGILILHVVTPGKEDVEICIDGWLNQGRGLLGNNLMSTKFSINRGKPKEIEEFLSRVGTPVNFLLKNRDLEWEEKSGIIAHYEIRVD